jgi:hypothetical protein
MEGERLDFQWDAMLGSALCISGELDDDIIILKNQ